jgi:hypothetical protein
MKSRASSAFGLSVVFTAAAVFTFTACSDDDKSSTAAAVTASATPGAKVDANTASEAELKAAFEAAGVSNAETWAHEVEEYRPYPDDPTFAKLRQDLGKYNIAPDVLEKIISTLEP